MSALENLIITTFYFGGLADMNSGILASVFVMCVVFTIITFYCKFDQKISKWDAIGTFLVILCVVLIAFGGALGIISKEDENEGGDIGNPEIINLMFALMFALFTSVFMSLRPLSMKYSLDVGFDVSQSFYDCNFFQSVVMFPFFVTFGNFEWFDIGLMFFGVSFLVIGNIALGKAVQYGNAGPVEAIENTKVVWQTILSIII